MSRCLVLLASSFLLALASAQPNDKKDTPKAKPKPASIYTHGPDSQEQPDVPHGSVTQMPAWKSQVFSGTVRDWWVYVPAQYDGKTPACVMVFQDGRNYVNKTGDFRVP